VLSRPIITQQYDQMVKYARALQLRTAEAEQILRRFNTRGPKHPTLLAIEELGRAVRTAFIADYLTSPNLRRELNDGAAGGRAVELRQRRDPLRPRG
jgi:TnpA family transposase